MNLIALDFDGVICDSASECLFTSFTVYARAKGEPDPEGLNSFSARWQKQFLELRPYIRDGKDYVLIQYFIDKAIRIESQEQFDAESQKHVSEACSLAGVSSPAQLEDLFQDSRRSIREANESAWLALNPLYPKMVEALAGCRERFEQIYITTSKPTDAALKILEHHQVPFAADQVYGKDRGQKDRGKNGHFEAISRVTGVPLPRFHFVDDQVSHLQYAIEARVPSYLATWGYNTEAQAKCAKESGAILLAAAGLPDWMKATVEA